MASERCIQDLPDRFLEKIAFCPLTGCWFWTGNSTRKGYGLARVKGNRDKRVMAHRAVYEAVVSDIPAGMQLDHLKIIRAAILGEKNP